MFICGVSSHSFLVLKACTFVLSDALHKVKANIFDVLFEKNNDHLSQKCCLMSISFG